MTLTNEDFKNIEKLIEVTLDEKLGVAVEDGIATKVDISHLPTKDDFYGKMDEVMGELKAIREEHVVSSGQIRDHEDRITHLEEKPGLRAS